MVKVCLKIHICPIIRYRGSTLHNIHISAARARANIEYCHVVLCYSEFMLLDCSIDLDVVNVY
jgi:hypothetical protein